MNKSFRLRRNAVLWISVLLLSCVSSAHAQSKGLCLQFFNSQSKIHTRVECVEALFSDPKWHFTLSSLPPGNGFAMGGMFEKETDYVTASHNIWSTDFKAALVGSINQSWVATGSFTLVPPVYTPERNKAQETCQRLGPFCTKTQLALHFEGTHRSLQTISFYGMGPRSTAIKHTFHQNDTYGGSSASLPLTNHIVSEGGVEILQPDLPTTSDPLSVSNNFTSVTAPGLQSQPTFIHPHIALLTAARVLSNPHTDDDVMNHTGPLMKRHLLFSFNNGAKYHWYPALNNSSNSFQQLVVKGDEVIELGSNVRRYVTVADVGQGIPRKLFYNILHVACGDGHEKLTNPGSYVIKVRQQCDYGRLDLQSQLRASYTGNGSVMPFYLQPTVGGSDINSQVSLRGFPNYRFRDRDSVFVQAEYTVPIVDPVGLLLFYDAGTVGPKFSSLSFAHLRQDAGVGATFRLQGNVVAQTYLAWGAGHGPTLNYNFSKLF